MIINKKNGDRVKIELLPVGRQRGQTHLVLESDLKIAWKRIILTSDPRYIDPFFVVEGVKWGAYSTLTGEKLAVISLTNPSPPRRRP